MKKSILSVILFTIILSCGGGGSNPPPPIDNVNPYITVCPPTCYTDNVPLDPRRDLKFWIFYAMSLDNNSESWFTDNNEVAYVEFDDTNAQKIEFNLNLLKPYIPKGEYLIGVKVQSMEGQKSEISDNTALWENL